MTITRLWQAGFESRRAEGMDTGTHSIQSVGRTGSWSYRVTVGDPNLSYRQGSKNITATRQLRVGTAWYMSSFQSGADGELVIIKSSGGNLIEVQPVKATSDLELIVAGSQEDVTTNSPITAGIQWFHLGIDCKIDAVSGWVKVYLNGVEVLSFSGNTGNADATSVAFGPDADLGNTGIYWYYDDIYIDDTTGEGSAVQCPMLRFHHIYPNADGTYSQWTGSDGNKASNYALVDETPPDEADYVEASGINLYDSYNMSTQIIGAGQTIDAVIVLALAQRMGVAEEMALGLRYSGTNVVGSGFDPGFGVYSYNWERQTEKPGGGSWDQTAIDGIEVLVKSEGTF